MEIISYREAARRLGVDRITISDLVRVLGLKVERHPSNGSALGLTPDAVSAIRETLDRKPLAQSA